MERNYCWGTILPRGFRGIINSLKKSMCKILLIKTKQNPYQCSADFTTKVASRTGRCHGVPSQAQEQLPTRVPGLAGSCERGGDSRRGRREVAPPVPRKGQLWRLWAVRKCCDTELWEEGQGWRGQQSPQESWGSARPPPLLWGQDNVTNPTQHRGARVGTELPPPGTAPRRHEELAVPTPGL